MQLLRMTMVNVPILPDTVGNSANVNPLHPATIRKAKMDNLIGRTAHITYLENATVAEQVIRSILPYLLEIYKKEMTYHIKNYVAPLWKTIRFNSLCK